MADALSFAETQLHRLRSRVREVKTNRKECQMLVSLAERTLATLRELEATQFESSMVGALPLTKDALEYAQEAVEKCCNVGSFSLLLFNETLTLHLKHVVEKLQDAFTAIPLASSRMTSELKSDGDALLAQICNATFEDKEATSHDTKALKDALEREFYLSAQADEGVKTGISTLPHDLTLEAEDQRKESLVHREYEDEETKNKEEQHELHSNQRVASVLETLDDVIDTPRIVHDLKDCLRCPISKRIMTDPVVLKDSGMTYDRSSIKEWLGRKHRHDPLTHVELVSGDLVSMPALHVACQTLMEQSEAHLSVGESSREEDSQPLLESGLYEAEGELFDGSKTVCASQLLILEPNGGVVGCTLYDVKVHGYPENNVEIGVGKWVGDTQELSFKDNYYDCHGNVEVFASHLRKKLRWSRNVSTLKIPVKEFASHLYISRPPKALFTKLHPTILQMEGNTDLSSNQVKFKSKLVLSLEVDSTIGGWTCFESSMQDSKIVGHITEGRWDENGRLDFSISFMMDKVSSNYMDAFKVSGIIDHDEILNHPTFVSSISRVKNESMLQSENTMRVPLNGVRHLDYPFVREASVRWHHIHPNALKLFQTPRSVLDSKSSQAVSSVKSNLEQGPSLSSQCALGGSSLQTMLQESHDGFVKERIAKDKNVTVSQKEGPTSLHIASRNGHIDVVKELIVNGADVNLQDNDGESPLHMASLKGHVDVVKELIVNGADVNLQDNDGESPLHMASLEGHVDVVKELIVNGADVNLQDNDGESPLHMASFEGHVDVVKELIVNGATINLQETNGWTPLCVASQSGHINVVKELIINGADVNLQDNIGMSPLNIASYRGHIDIVKELIVNGANVNLQAKYGWSHLYIASYRGHIDIVKELIVNGANVNLQSKYGWSPLYIASRNGHINIVKELIVSDADVNLQDNIGMSPLNIASYRGHIDIVKELIVNGADIDLQEKDGWTPLHIASRCGHVSIVQFLLKNGASKGIRNKQGKTPYDVMCTGPYSGSFDETTITQLKDLLKK